jgi:hypothetical protein
MKTFWNFLTVIVFLLIAVLVIWGVMIYLNPYHFLNPFPPTRPESQVLVGWCLAAPLMRDRIIIEPAFWA